MWRKIRARRSARRAAKNPQQSINSNNIVSSNGTTTPIQPQPLQQQRQQQTPLHHPNRNLRPTHSNPQSTNHVGRTPSLPQDSSKTSSTQPTRAHTDIGTTRDPTSINQNLQTIQSNPVTTSQSTSQPLPIPKSQPFENVNESTSQNHDNLHLQNSSTPTNTQPSSLTSPAAVANANLASRVKPVEPGVNETNRRLSLDGDLPPDAIRPDDEHQGPDDDDRRDATLTEGRFVVDFQPFNLYSPIDVSACSKAGWEPVRTQLGSVPPMHTVEVRKENQDAFCVFAPFGPDDIINKHDSDTSADDPKTEQENDNNHQSLSITPQIFLGVFDGHGAQGRPIAHHTRDFISTMTRHAASKVASPPPARAVVHGHDRVLPSNISADLHRARLDILKAAFSRAERALTESDTGIDHVFSGTTAVVAWLFGRDIYTAWTGDSRCVVGRTTNPENGRIRFKAIELSHDQKPVRADEKRRVRSAGGRIARWQRNVGPMRVWLPRDWTPGLAMTRSIGDTILSEFGVSPVPEVTFTQLGSSDSFIVLASDGVWEFMSSQEVVDFIGRMRREDRSASDASEALVREAVRRWRRNEVVVDDTTAVVMWMNWDEENDAEESRNHSKKMESGGGKHRKMFSMSRTKATAKTTSSGVHLVSDDGILTDFYCKNDMFSG